MTLAKLLDQHAVTMTGTYIFMERYLEMMADKGIEVRQSDTGTGLPHCHWMLHTMTERLGPDPDFDLWKANRWLGFIQRELVLAGWITVQEERDLSRPFFKPSEKLS